MAPADRSVRISSTRRVSLPASPYPLSLPQQIVWTSSPSGEDDLCFRRARRYSISCQRRGIFVGLVEELIASTSAGQAQTGWWTLIQQPLRAHNSTKLSLHTVSTLGFESEQTESWPAARIRKRTSSPNMLVCPQSRLNACEMFFQLKSAFVHAILAIHEASAAMAPFIAECLSVNNPLMGARYRERACPCDVGSLRPWRATRVVGGPSDTLVSQRSRKVRHVDDAFGRLLRFLNGIHRKTCSWKEGMSFSASRVSCSSVLTTTFLSRIVILAECCITRRE